MGTRRNREARSAIATAIGSAIARLRAGRLPVRELAATLCLAATLAAMPGIGSAGFVDSAVCRAHLQKIETQLTQSGAALTGQRELARDASCDALYGQIRVMLAARNVYNRCATGAERTERVGRVNGHIDIFAERVSLTCNSR